MADQKVIAESKEAYETLLKDFQSIQLGTATKEGTPEASYNPAVVDENRNLYIYVSDMSAHTANILGRQEASAMIIEDESACAQIFARKRVTFHCKAEEIEPESEAWEKVIPLFLEKFGKMFNHLLDMGDFHLIALRPTKGRLVVGFGRAFDIVGDRMDELQHVGGAGGKGHLPKGHGSRKSEPLTEEAVQGMIDHMNDDHSDSVLMYAQHFADRKNAQSAVLKAVTPEHMVIHVDAEDEVHVPFPKKLETRQDAHMIMVKMSKEAREALTA